MAMIDPYVPGTVVSSCSGVSAGAGVDEGHGGPHVVPEGVLQQCSVHRVTVPARGWPIAS